MPMVFSLAEVLAGIDGSRRVAALGTFDGIHKGHMAILAAANRMAAQLDAPAAAITFDQLPLQLLAADKAPKRLTSSRRRIELLADIVGEVIVIRFDKELAKLSAAGFVRDVLVGGLHCAGAVAGFNFTFGQQAQGTAETLITLGRAAGMAIEIVAPVLISDKQVSSTLIRDLVSRGEVETAVEFLGRPFSLEGTVVAGAGVGRTLGYPTANLSCESGAILPADGVYLTEVLSVPDRTPIGTALTVISVRPTFNGADRLVETHILDYTGDLYGMQLEVLFRRRLRDIVRYDTAAQLQAGIAADIAAARRYGLLSGIAGQH